MILDSGRSPIQSLAHPLKENKKRVGLMVLTHVPGLGTGLPRSPFLGYLMVPVTGCDGQMSPDMALLLFVWGGTAQKG